VGADDADSAVLGEEPDQGLPQLRGGNVGAIDGGDALMELDGRKWRKL
jgi:hypothetical protein